MHEYLWLVVIPNIDFFLGVVGILGITSCIIGGFIYIHKKTEAYTEKDHLNAHKFGYRMLKVFAASMILFFITCFIPTKKDLIQLKVISVISELKDVDQIPQKLIDRLNELLDEL